MSSQARDRVCKDGERNQGTERKRKEEKKTCYGIFSKLIFGRNSRPYSVLSYCSVGEV